MRMAVDWPGKRAYGERWVGVHVPPFIVGYVERRVCYAYKPCATGPNPSPQKRKVKYRNV